MITDENKKLAQWAMDYALKNGCQAAKVLLYSSSNTSFELRDAKMDRLQQASEGGLSLSLYVDGRYGSISTNRLNRKELETFIKNGIDSTRYLAKDEARVLADPSRYYKGGKPDLKLYDAKFASLNPDDKIEMAKAVAEEALGKDERIISVGSSYGDGEDFAYRLISNGFEGETKSTWYSLSADITIRGEGEARPSERSDQERNRSESAGTRIAQTGTKESTVRQIYDGSRSDELQPFAKSDDECAERLGFATEKLFLAE